MKRKNNKFISFLMLSILCICSMFSFVFVNVFQAKAVDGGTGNMFTDGQYLYCYGSNMRAHIIDYNDVRYTSLQVYGTHKVLIEDDYINFQFCNLANSLFINEVEYQLSYEDLYLRRFINSSGCYVDYYSTQDNAIHRNVGYAEINEETPYFIEKVNDCYYVNFEVEDFTRDFQVNFLDDHFYYAKYDNVGYFQIRFDKGSSDFFCDGLRLSVWQEYGEFYIHNYYNLNDYPIQVLYRRPEIIEDISGYFTEHSVDFYNSFYKFDFNSDIKPYMVILYSNENIVDDEYPSFFDYIEEMHPQDFDTLFGRLSILSRNFTPGYRDSDEFRNDDIFYHNFGFRFIREMGYKLENKDFIENVYSSRDSSYVPGTNPGGDSGESGDGETTGGDSGESQGGDVGEDSGESGDSGDDSGTDEGSSGGQSSGSEDGDTTGGDSSGSDDKTEILDHEHNLVFVEKVPPHCVDKGYDLYHCKDCAYIYTDNYVNELGHSYVNNVCSVCGLNNPNVCNHSYSFIRHDNATCVKYGGDLYRCELCHTYSMQNIISALGHHFVNGKCTVCNELEKVDEDTDKEDETRQDEKEDDSGKVDDDSSGSDSGEVIDDKPIEIPDEDTKPTKDNKEFIFDLSKFNLGNFFHPERFFNAIENFFKFGYQGGNPLDLLLNLFRFVLIVFVVIILIKVISFVAKICNSINMFFIKRDLRKIKKENKKRK